ncbi:SagB family peptide dehydrogenase [Streptomyces sp. MS1.AVA.4]|uniref:SagB family peptide dehydrogenase n=1 Tax=Streptomyces pratisoli TaxID=3139917 RepID=A0ACC6QB70_9ACTN
MGYAHEYAAAIMQRGRVPMPPADFVPDWSDGPRKTKFYPGTDMLPLPACDYPSDATLAHAQATATATEESAGRAFDLVTLSGMLRDSYGLTGRRLGVQANTDLDALPWYPLANWSRGTASGGGLYPVSVYWVGGPSGPVPPGVHHYATRHHAMQRLLTGDVSGEVREALGDSAPGAETDQFLVLSVKYWQNAFKYNSFSFHAVTMDVGTVVQTWRMWARPLGLAVEPLMWFDEERLARLLGVRTEEEGVFAVVPLHWQGAAARPAPAPGTAAVRRHDVERSRRVLAFEAVRKMQAATAERAAERPAAGALDSAAAPAADPDRAVMALPAARPPATDVRTALRRRRSSFGRFDAQRPMTAEQLATCLAAATAGAALGGDTGTGTGTGTGTATGIGMGTDTGATSLATLYAFVSHVEGVPAGAYAYDPAGHALRLVKSGPPGEFLQRNYFLANYNLEQAAAVLVPAVRTTAVLDAVGDRGYRLVNAVVGAVAQSLYTAASALDLGCGVALGFDNISYMEELGLAETGQSPLLIMMLGNERPAPADFRYEIA